MMSAVPEDKALDKPNLYLGFSVSFIRKGTW